MKIIDLLNKIANGEEVPNRFIYNGCLYENYQNGCYRHYDYDGRYTNIEKFVNKLCDDFCNLNDEVEIGDDEYKETKPLTKQDIEALGYACGEIQKCFTNGWNKSLENKPFKEDKEIEKIDIMSDEATPNSYYILNEHGTKCYLTKHSKVIADRVNLLIDKVNNMENKQ